MSTYKHIVHGDLEGQSDSIINNFAIPTFTTTTESNAYLTRGGLMCFVGTDLYVKPNTATAPFKAVPASLSTTLNGSLNAISNLRIVGSNLLFDYTKNDASVVTVTGSIASAMVDTQVSDFARFGVTSLSLTQNNGTIWTVDLAPINYQWIVSITDDSTSFQTIEPEFYATRGTIHNWFNNKLLSGDITSASSTALVNANQVKKYVDSRPTSTKTTNYTVTPNDYTIRVDATSGARIITLPNANTMTGQIINIKKVDISTNTVTVNANGTQKIDDLTTKIITDPYTNLQLQSYGTGWDIL